MPITAIRTRDIFHTDDLNSWEERMWPQIIFGINTAWTNLDGHSVAYQVGQRYCIEFQRIMHHWRLQIGDVHSAQWCLDNVTPARFHGIVCNERTTSGKHDWTFGDLWVTEWLEKLASGQIIRQRQVETRIASVRDEVQELLARWFDFNQLVELVKNAEHEIHPPVRTAFIGTGPSGTQNHADWRSILQAMNDSTLNLVLYLWNQEVAAQVANVVRLFPELRASVPLRRIEEERLAA